MSRHKNRLTAQSKRNADDEVFFVLPLSLTNHPARTPTKPSQLEYLCYQLCHSNPAISALTITEKSFRRASSCGVFFVFFSWPLFAGVPKISFNKLFHFPGVFVLRLEARRNIRFNKANTNTPSSGRAVLPLGCRTGESQIDDGFHCREGFFRVISYSSWDRPACRTAPGRFI